MLTVPAIVGCRIMVGVFFLRSANQPNEMALTNYKSLLPMRNWKLENVDPVISVRITVLFDFQPEFPVVRDGSLEKRLGVGGGGVGNKKISRKGKWQEKFVRRETQRKKFMQKKGRILVSSQSNYSSQLLTQPTKLQCA